MMICPQTKAECDATRCLDYGCCGPSECPPKPVECSDFKLFTSDRSEFAKLSTYQQVPSMEEIERLVDALVDAALYDDVPDAQAARAALLAAIRAYGEGK